MGRVTEYASQSGRKPACGDPSPTLGERDLGAAGTAQVAALRSSQEPRVTASIHSNRSALFLPRSQTQRGWQETVPLFSFFEALQRR
jgi:hypothetical protein